MTSKQEECPTENGTAIAFDSGVEDKSLTFRKRRLSLTHLRQFGDDKEQEEPQSEEHNGTEELQLQPPAPLENPQQHGAARTGTSNGTGTSTVEDEKAHSFRKRRLSLTHSREDASSQDDEPPNQRRRRASDASMSSLDSAPKHPKKRLKSRTVHAAELLAHPPPSPSIHKLYHQRSAPPQRLSLDTIPGANEKLQPKWRKRHTRQLHEDERTLPFPRDIVGTFSCHGVEPIYEDDYVVEEDGKWVVGNTNANTSPVDPDEPTTAAKINQDRGGVAFPYGNCPRTALFAVYDGHGQGGELVSQFALHEVQRRLEKHEDFTKNVEKAFKETFLAVDKDLKEECLIEPLYAGTTACAALLREHQLVLANAGDSRAVLARKTKHGKYSAIDLTKDQNPDLPAEQARIESRGGFVSPPPEPGLSARVWLDIDCTQIGLAMARSIGDHAVKEIGVIAEPVVSFHDITPDDDFVIFATDGVWEFISSEAAVQIVADNLDRGATRACQALIEVAAAKWHDEEGDYRDDITALVVRLPHLWKSDHAQKSLQANKSG